MLEMIFLLLSIAVVIVVLFNITYMTIDFVIFNKQMKKEEIKIKDAMKAYITTLEEEEEHETGIDERA